jgi:hypothetical protein
LPGVPTDGRIIGTGAEGGTLGFTRQKGVARLIIKTRGELIDSWDELNPVSSCGEATELTSTVNISDSGDNEEYYR